MKNISFILAAALLCFCANPAYGDLLDCDEKILPSLSELPIIGPKVAEDSGEHKVRDFFKNVGCSVKSGTEDLTDGAKEFGTGLKEGTENVGEMAKDMGSDIKDKIGALKERFSSESLRK